MEGQACYHISVIDPMGDNPAIRDRDEVEPAPLGAADGN